MKNTTIGRPKLPEGQRKEQKGITLIPDEWAALAAADPDGSATREAARRLRRSLAKDTLPPARNVIPVKAERYDGPGWGRVELTNGVSIRLHGDGTGIGDDGRTYVAISRRSGDDFEFVGYADRDDTEV